MTKMKYDSFTRFTGIELKENEDFYTYKNEYNELCYAIFDMNTNEIIEKNAF